MVQDRWVVVWDHDCKLCHHVVMVGDHDLVVSDHRLMVSDHARGAAEDVR